MKVILQQNVQKLGKAGDVVDASDGYFRNFLQPRKLAIVATNGTLKKREEDLESIRKKAETAHQQFVELSEKIKAIGSVRLEAKAGEGGKLYGKITTKEIAQHLSKQLGTPIDKKDIKASDDINALGTYKVVIKLAPEVQADLNIEVALEGSPIVEKKAPAPVVEQSEEATTEAVAETEPEAAVKETPVKETPVKEAPVEKAPAAEKATAAEKVASETSK
jgi:large subunit ribosomal protein L9